ncbi:hypothetical protein QSH57_014647 [Fusarium oxysporum f. sp. vasinfectum]|nr:hypothetical protein QSH57_014647 [Fusarium oxysporum f. sp. vasinfectum]
MSSDGHIVSEADYSNIDNPAANSPLIFTSEPSIGNGGGNYGPPTRYVAYEPSYLAVKIGDKGIVDGVVRLSGIPGGGPHYLASIAGSCMKVRTPVAV